MAEQERMTAEQVVAYLRDRSPPTPARSPKRRSALRHRPTPIEDCALRAALAKHRLDRVIGMHRAAESEQHELKVKMPTGTNGGSRGYKGRTPRGESRHAE